jgi:hypothetical protein
MKLNYTTFRLANVALNDNENAVQQVMTVGELTLICCLYFDTDDTSDTYKRWICTLDVVSDTEDVPERSLVLYPNTLHFEGDDRYVVSVTADLEEIGHGDLQNVFMTIGVPADE